MQSIGESDDFGCFVHHVSRASERKIPLPEAGAHRAVLEHRHGCKRLDDLVSAGDAAASDAIGRFAGDVLSFEENPALIRGIDTVNDIEHGRFAGAVRTNKPEDLAVCDREAEIMNRVDSAEALVDARDLEQCGHWSSLRVRGHRLYTKPMSPPGANSTIPSSSNPAITSWK